MSDYLKVLCEKAKIDETVKAVKYKGRERTGTTYKKYEVTGAHTARRTSKSLSFQKGMKHYVIIAITRQ